MCEAESASHGGVAAGPMATERGKLVYEAMDAGHEADHPHGADWWAWKKEAADMLRKEGDDPQEAALRKLNGLSDQRGMACAWGAESAGFAQSVPESPTPHS